MKSIQKLLLCLLVFGQSGVSFAQVSEDENLTRAERKERERRANAIEEDEEERDFGIGGVFYRQQRSGVKGAFGGASAFHSVVFQGWGVKEGHTGYGSFEMGSSDNGGFLFSMDVMGGGNFNWKYVAMGLIGGLGVNGVGGLRLPYSLTVPFRPFVAFTGPRLGAIFHYETRFLLASDTRRRDGSKETFLGDAEVSYGGLIKLFGFRLGGGQKFIMGSWSPYGEIGFGSSL